MDMPSWNNYDRPFSLRCHTRSRLSFNPATRAVSVAHHVKEWELFTAPESPQGRILFTNSGHPTGLSLEIAPSIDGHRGVHYIRRNVGEYLSVHKVNEVISITGNKKKWEEFVLEPAGATGESAVPNAISELENGGFTLLHHLLSPREARELYRIIDVAESIGGAQYRIHENNIQYRIGELPKIAGADMLTSVAADPLIHDVLSEYLGRNFRLATWSSNTLKPGNTPGGPCGLGWHIDYPYHDVVQDRPGTLRSTGQPPLGCQVLWFLNDVDVNNGGTMFYPASHLTEGIPAGITHGGNQTPLSSYTLSVPAGTVLIAHSAWWHRQTNNMTADKRIVLLGNYTPGYIVPKGRFLKNITIIFFL